MSTNASPPTPRSDLRASNRRTAFVLATIAATFFVGIIGSRFIGGQTTGLSILGIAVLLFLVVAIGRNLSDKR